MCSKGVWRPLVIYAGWVCKKRSLVSNKPHCPLCGVLLSDVEFWVMFQMVSVYTWAVPINVSVCSHRVYLVFNMVNAYFVFQYLFVFILSPFWNLRLFLMLRLEAVKPIVRLTVWFSLKVERSCVDAFLRKQCSNQPCTISDSIGPGSFIPCRPRLGTRYEVSLIIRQTLSAMQHPDYIGDGGDVISPIFARDWPRAAVGHTHPHCPPRSKTGPQKGGCLNPSELDQPGCA